MSFPPAFLDEIRTRLTLSEVIGKRIRLTRAGREYKACCPFHNEKSPSFYINDDKLFYHCFGCGAHGDVIGFTMRHDRMSFPEAVEVLAGQAGLQVPRDTPVDREKFDAEKRLTQLLERATVWFEEQLWAPVGREALAYLRQRGLSEDAIRRFRLGYAPADAQALLRVCVAEKYSIDELLKVGLAKKSEERNDHYSFFRNRVIFPVGDRRGRTVAFGGRVLADGEPKYLNSPDHILFHKGKLLYGLSRARTVIGQGQPLIVVEGYMDVIALVEAGFSGAVAPLGTALTEDQLALLWKLLPPPDARDPSQDMNPILCFDGDNAGLRAAMRGIDRALPLLTPTQSLRIAFLPEGRDPDDLIKQSGKSGMDAILKQAKPMIDVVWDIALAGRNLRTPEERGALIANLKQRVSVIQHEGLRKLYSDEIQKRLSTLFEWKKEPPVRQPFVPRSGSGHGAGKGYGQGRFAPTAPISLAIRKQPPEAQKLREKALLAVMINHPTLFSDFGEDLALRSFQTPDFEALRQRLVEILSLDSSEPLDATELYRHLSSVDDYGAAGGNGAAVLADVLSETTYMHVGFARPHRPTDQARQGWKSIWDKWLQEQLHVDLQDARRAYAENASDENMARLMALRSQIETLMNESDDTNASESATI
jgi:DNA primase